MKGGENNSARNKKGRFWFFWFPKILPFVDVASHQFCDL